MYRRGTYGCVFSPPLKCKYNNMYNSVKKDNVMKVMKVNNKSLEEEISAILRILDPNYEYTIPLSGDKCIIEHDDRLKYCSSYDIDHGMDYRGYFIKPGGVTLDDYLEYEIIDAISIVFIIKHLCYGLNMLHNNGIAHLDIKANNILVDNGVPKFIDFGMSNFKDNYTDDLLYFKYYPLFHCALSSIKYYGDDNNIALNKLYKKFEHLAKFFYKNEYVKGDINKDIIYSLYSSAKNNKTYFNDVILENYFKIDTFCLFDVINDYLYNDYSKILENHRKTMKEISTLINYSIHINPSQQKTIKEIVEIIDMNNMLTNIN